MFRRVRGDGGVGEDRRGGSGEGHGLGDGLPWREGDEDLLLELSREFRLKRPVLKNTYIHNVTSVYLNTPEKYTHTHTSMYCCLP